jgi:hypothetical protein
MTDAKLEEPEERRWMPLRLDSSLSTSAREFRQCLLSSLGVATQKLLSFKVSR